MMKEFLELPNNISHVPTLGTWIENVGEKMQLAPDKIFNLNLAIEEAVVNVMNYAYPGKEGKVYLQAYDEDGHVFVVIEDEGIPFDPLAKDDPDVTLAAEDRPIGGLGIFLVKELMTDVSYEWKGGRNILKVEV